MCGERVTDCGTVNSREELQVGTCSSGEGNSREKKSNRLPTAEYEKNAHAHTQIGKKKAGGAMWATYVYRFVYTACPTLVYSIRARAR